VNTLIGTRSEQTPLSTISQPSQQKGANPWLFQTTAIGGLITTALAISQTGVMDLCSWSGPMALMVAWFVLPVTAIASIAGVAATTNRTIARYFSATVAVGFTAMWLFALVWAQVGDAVNQVAC
jgi:hypothetical protein